MSEAEPAAFTGARLRPVERTSTASVVARQVLDELAKDRFVSGTRLPSERLMAEALGVGRSTLREAMAALDLLGIIEVRPGSGSYLRADSSQLLPQALTWGLKLGQPHADDLVDMREHLELLAARRAAERATDEDVAALRAHVDRMNEPGRSVAAFVEADIAFHLQVAAIARNSVLASVLQSIRSLLHDWFERTLSVEGTMAATAPEHEAVWAAIRDHDPAAAETAMATLMAHADLRLRQTL